MINWPIIPMTYNDSFTYMEWLGKLTYIAENHEGRIDDCEKNIVDLWTKVNNHESRIGELEDWRTNTVDPFIEETRDTLADHEERIRQNTNDIAALYNWKINTVDPFVNEISGWKTNTVDPFIQSTDTWIDEVAEPFMNFITDWRIGTIDPFVASTTDELTRLGANATAEASARRNADNELSDRVTSVTTVANETKNKVNRLEIQMQNVGTVRYFMDTAIISSDGYGGTNLSVVLPDEDWVTCDVRFLAGSNPMTQLYGPLQTLSVLTISFTLALLHRLLRTRLILTSTMQWMLMVMVRLTLVMLHLFFLSTQMLQQELFQVSIAVRKLGLGGQLMLLTAILMLTQTSMETERLMQSTLLLYLVTTHTLLQLISMVLLDQSL